MIVWKKSFLAQITVLLMILSLVSPATKSFAQGDITPPTLNSFTVSAKEASVGDQVKISADVTDDLTGVQSVYVYYRNPNDTGSKYVPISYNSTTGKYEGTFDVDQYDAEGEWTISSISVYDKQDNYYRYYNGTSTYKTSTSEYRDLSNYDINVYGTSSDVTPPTLNSFTVSATEASVGDQVKISADVTDDLTGVQSVYVYYRNPNDTGSKYVPISYNSTTGKYEVTFNVGQYDAEGEWTISSISVYDKQDNYYRYYNGTSTYKTSTSEYRDLSDYDINVYGTSSDVTPPTLNSFTVSATEASVGEKVKISADVTDDLTGVQSVYVYYRNPNDTGSKYVPISYNSTTGKYEGIFNVGQYDAEGEWTISSISVYDKQDNYYRYYNGTSTYKTNTSEYRDLSNYNITIGPSDQTSPVTKIELQSASPKVNEWYSSNVNVSLNATDDQSGVAKTFYKINNGDWNEYTNAFELQNEGVNTVEYKSIDNAGNEEEIKTEVVKIDKTTPVTAASNVPTNWTNKDDSITLSATDEISGVAKTEYRINNGEWTEYTEPIKSFTEGKNIVDYRSIDNAGNVESYKSFEVDLDKTAPVTTTNLVKDGWYNTDVDLTLESSDNLSGVATTQYKVNNGDWLTYNNSITISNEGINKVQYRSIDNAGNVEETKSMEVKIDKTAPTLNVSFDQSVITDRNHKLVPINASVEAADSLSGVDSYELVSIISNQQDNGKGDGNTTQDIQGAEFSIPDTNFLVRAERSGSGDRVYTVTYKATDTAGNTVNISQDILVKHDNSKK
ncbi:Ig-like domain repeat protein [Bacillus sp. V3B]|uniref:OmpL47-type beta-barrel domain-containing protein n=1 Tax=Bacillus sp. V3B TaxID=2804915 RepID=UPI00210D2B33|nr:Ig-like domain repeat protein [Bacillus sp. V3B]MCQ6276755.1 Ig-like domain repeat protein [Bacillus sp. V3B]